MVEITATNSTQEPWRMLRLATIITKLAVAEIQFNTGINNIITLHDHKGMLEVTWSNEPGIEQKKYINKIWVQENEIQVIHYCKESE